MGSIQLSEVTKAYAGDAVVKQVSLEIADGEFMVLVGPSGCGKSTLLRMIAGIESLSDGQIFIGEMDASHVAPKERNIAMVFQNYALYPHMTVAENLEFALRLRRVAKAEREARANDAMRMLRLTELARRRPSQLSGGQRQRVAMGRAIVRDPAAFLMDEPLSNLDAKLRVAMRAELARLHDRLGTTTVYVTHDQTEAMTLGRRVAVMRHGVLQQVDTPMALFERPANLFVAAFIGSPTINLARAEIADGRLRMGSLGLAIPPGARLGDRREVIVGIRPSSFELAELAHESWERIPVTVEVVENLGAERHVIFPVDVARVAVEDVEVSGGDADSSDGQLLADERSLFTAVLPVRGAAISGQKLELAIDTSRLLFFDATTGLVLNQ